MDFFFISNAIYISGRDLLSDVLIGVKVIKEDIQDTAEEAGTSSLVMFSYGPPHMAEQKQEDQLEPTYSSSVRIRDVALRTYQKR